MKINKDKLNTNIKWYLVVAIVLFWYLSITKTIKLGQEYFYENRHIARQANAALPDVLVEPYDMKDWVLWRWEKEGQREMANKIITCESNWSMNATNINTNKTFDFSLYQWNSIHIKSGFMTAECLGSYKCQTEKAIQMWKKQGWRPWVCSRLVK